MSDSQLAQVTRYIPALVLFTPSLLSLAAISVIRELRNVSTKPNRRVLISMSAACTMLAIASLIGLATNSSPSLTTQICYSIFEGLGIGLSLFTIADITTYTGLTSLSKAAFNNVYHKFECTAIIIVILLPTMFTIFEITTRLCTINVFGLSVFVHHGLYFTASAIMLLNRIAIVLGMIGILINVDFDLKKLNFNITLTYQILLVVENIIHQTIENFYVESRKISNAVSEFSYRHRSIPIGRTSTQKTKGHIHRQVGLNRLEKLRRDMSSLRTSNTTHSSFEAGNSSTIDTDSVDANLNSFIDELKSQMSDPILDYRITTITNSSKTPDNIILHMGKGSPSSTWTFQQNSKFLLDNLANNSDETINYTA
ncbi:hypothetical protein E3Q17_04261 [Wallemia mellicola]|uniref:Uncharacterized protein n=1 Tax=Wallemia mellicola TaxID=1708541 RepID=A0A4T0P9W1_9BASI|nr:hypothetical protein E3Q17_04261 [Wallemia mellicola]TIC07195.1 hypothetical protein E3Q14_04349 [Wallemia mellicola]